MLEDEGKEKGTTFMDIPVEVIDGYVLPNLRWNDLLRFRRVCKLTAVVTNDFIQLHPELAPEIEINEDGKSFGEFLKMGIPTTKIFLNNLSGEDFYRNAGKSGQKFLKEYGPLVKHLRVEELSPYLYGEELTFLEGLKNLESFELEHFGNASTDPTGADKPQLKSKAEAARKRALKDRRFKKDSKPIPKIFKQLKEIKIGNNRIYQIHGLVGYMEEILETCRDLEYMALPFSEYLETQSYRCPGSLAKAFDLIGMTLEDKTAGSQLKTVDFKSFHSIQEGNEESALGMGSPAFLELCSICIKHGIKLLNVGSSWFFDWSHYPEIPPPDLGLPVYSLVNLHPTAVRMNMPKLERLQIKSSTRSSPGIEWLQTQSRPEWPSLKILDMTVDSEMCRNLGWVPGTGELTHLEMTASILFHFLFGGVTREALSELRLHFTEDARREILPKTEDIVASCPNLKKLTLINWLGTNKCLLKLWKGLPKLEEVCLENCKDLGNAAFLGENVDSPVFLNLTNLKNLSLKGLDQMPKITDALFSLVIRHLPLTHLTLTSAAPIKSVTMIGIISLLKGKFAESVEKFPFKGWSMKGVSSKAMAQLESKFRSSSML